jgi:hypothetical protein
VLFVFWVLEGIAKAKRRGQMPDPPPVGEDGLPADLGRDREADLLLELAERARRAAEAERAPARAEIRRAPPAASPPSRWEQGTEPEVAPGRLTQSRPSDRNVLRAPDKPRPAVVPAAALVPSPPRALDGPREVRSRPSLRESRMAESSAPQVVRASAAPLNVRRLSGATAADLRRLMVLKEVLGPPVALRDDPTGREFD